MKHDIEIEVLDINNNPTNNSLVVSNAVATPKTIDLSQQSYKVKQKRDLAEELALAILTRFQELDTLKFRFLDSSLTGKEKLEELLKFKTAMMIPSLRMSLGLDFNPEVLKGTYDVLNILNNIESSVNNMIRHEENETINFSNPKIISSYKMLFEVIVNIMNEEITDGVIINNIIEKVAVRCVNIEQEFNKIFKTVSNRMAEMVENPLIGKFSNKERDPDIAKLRLIDELRLAKRNLDIPEIDKLLSVLTNTQSI